MSDANKARRKEIQRQIKRIDQSIALREEVLKDQREMRQRLTAELESLPPQ